MSQSLQSDQVDQIIPALIKARASIDHARMDAKNPFFKSTYASLESVIDATTSALLAESLVVSQATVTIDTIPHVATTLFHKSGQWIRSFTQVLYSEAANQAQAQGAGLTYARRYGLAALLNIGQEDDDANSAGTRPRPQTQTPTQSKPAPAKKAEPAKEMQKSGGDFVITFGAKFKGLTIAQAVTRDGLPTVQKFVQWLEANAEQKGQPLGADARFLKVNLERYQKELEAEVSNADFSKDDFDSPPEWVTNGGGR